jgi:hypothetical protein
VSSEERVSEPLTPSPDELPEPDEAPELDPAPNEPLPLSEDVIVFEPPSLSLYVLELDPSPLLVFEPLPSLWSLSFTV